jgi:D-aminopeptidase
MNVKHIIFIFLMILPVYQMNTIQTGRCRDFGIHPGTLNPGQFNAITDVAGVTVGSVTITTHAGVTTGVTVILPHPGNIFKEKFYAGVYVGNGFGKALGFLQIEELGTLESPIALTNTLNVGSVADALVSYILDLPGNSAVRSVNVIVGETNDGRLNDIRGRHVSAEHVFSAIKNAKTGTIEEGSVGAGRGTICFGYKGGIGTSSRLLPTAQGGYIVGALVQANFGGVLTINGVPVGQGLKNSRTEDTDDGSCMMVIATDAPLSPRNLKRLAKRAMFGLARTGGYASNGSGDFVIAFSTANKVPDQSDSPTESFGFLRNEQMSPLFLATVEATEEAIYNALFRATVVCKAEQDCVEPIPVERVLKIMRQFGRIGEMK